MPEPTDSGTGPPADAVGGLLSPPGAAWPGRTGAGRASRATTAGLVALTGLALLTLGPSVVAFGWHEFSQARAAAHDTSQPVGTPVHDGPIGFVVHGLHCEASEETAHGRWCEVRVSARNHGQEEITIAGGAQHLHSGEGTRHLPVSGERPFGTLEPGEDATAVLEFDVPPHAGITHVVVHASPYSGGVMVDLIPD